MADEHYQKVFRDNYAVLCNYCFLLINNKEAAEDLVQDLFVVLWENWPRLQHIESLTTYLRKASRNRALNYLKQSQKKWKWTELDHLEYDDSKHVPAVTDELEKDELEKIIHQAILQLPERCRTIFLLKRMEEMTNREIADRLDVSVKTVEAQMTIALRRLYAYVAKHWELCLGLFLLVSFTTL